MSILFPTSLDNLTNPVASDAQNSVTVPHATQHADVNDAIEAIEAKVGINSSAVNTSLDYKVAANATAITSEASTRASADSSEASTRASADTTLSGLITAEAASRVSGDAASVSTAASDATSKANAAQAAAIAASQPLDSDLTSWAGVTRAAGLDTFAATPSSANLRSLLTDESGTGAAYFQGGDLGTPSAGVATNLSGTAASLTAGHVTTNANLTGPITSSGNATAIAAQTGTGNTFAMSAGPTISDIILSGLIGMTGIEDNITAHAGGGQVSAFALDATKSFHRVTTVGSIADSVKLPAIVVGKTHYVFNAGGLYIRVYAVSSPDTINAPNPALGGIDIWPGSGVFFHAIGSDGWVTVGHGLNPDDNLASLKSASTSRTNLGLDTMATQAANNVNITGGVINGSRFIPKVFTLTDGATVNIDASLGNMAEVTLAGDRTFAAPTNPIDGQKIEIRAYATAVRTNIWNAAFVAGRASIPLTTQIGYNFWVIEYNGADTNWYFQVGA